MMVRTHAEALKDDVVAAPVAKVSTPLPAVSSWYDAGVRLTGAEEIEESFPPTWKIIELKREGEATVARRAEIAAKSKIMALKKEGAEVIAQRADLAAKSKIMALKRDGAATIALRAERSVPAVVGSVAPTGGAASIDGGVAPAGFEWAGVF